MEPAMRSSRTPEDLATLSPAKQLPQRQITGLRQAIRSAYTEMHSSQSYIVKVQKLQELYSLALGVLGHRPLPRGLDEKQAEQTRRRIGRVLQAAPIPTIEAKVVRNAEDLKVVEINMGRDTAVRSSVPAENYEPGLTFTLEHLHMEAYSKLIPILGFVMEDLRAAGLFSDADENPAKRNLIEAGP